MRTGTSPVVAEAVHHPGRHQHERARPGPQLVVGEQEGELAGEDVEGVVLVLVGVALQLAAGREVDDPEREAGRVGGARQELDVAHPAALPGPHDDRMSAHRPMLAQTLYAASWTVLGGEVAVPCHPQSALAGLNSRLRGFAFGASTPDRGVEGRVPRGERSRIRSDPGGSSLKRYRSCAADQPGRSRRSAGTPEDELRRRVHGPLSLLP